MNVLAAFAQLGLRDLVLLSTVWPPAQAFNPVYGLVSWSIVGPPKYMLDHLGIHSKVGKTSLDIERGRCAKCKRDGRTLDH